MYLVSADWPSLSLGVRPSESFSSPQVPSGPASCMLLSVLRRHSSFGLICSGLQRTRFSTHSLLPGLVGASGSLQFQGQWLGSEQQRPAFRSFPGRSEFVSKVCSALSGGRKGRRNGFLSPLFPDHQRAGVGRTRASATSPATLRVCSLGYCKPSL